MSNNSGFMVFLFGSCSNSMLNKSVGLDSTPQEEFLSLLGGARTSPAVQQFLFNFLGEMVYSPISKISLCNSDCELYVHSLVLFLVGSQTVAKIVSGAGKEVQNIVLDYLPIDMMFDLLK